MKIAFIGESGSGKDYLTGHLIEKYNFSRISFSDQLKKKVSSIFPWIEKDYPPLVKEQPLNLVTEFGDKIEMTPREIWLKFDMLRTIDPHVFVREVRNEMNYLRGVDIVISDIRTPEEFHFCDENDFILVYIEPLEQTYEKNSFDDFARSCKTEADIVFVNDFKGIDSFEEFLIKNRIVNGN